MVADAGRLRTVSRLSLEYCQQLLNQLGKVGFDRECQQLVDVVDEENDFREYNEVFHIATVSEVIAGFKRNGATLHADRHGNLVIPDRWECGDGHDWGTTVNHPAVYAVFSRPDERFPFSDVHLGLIERCLPKYPRDRNAEAELVSPGRFSAIITQARKDFGLQDSQIKLSLMSHEASAALNSYLLDCPDETKVFFSKWKAAKGSGVPQIQNLLEIDHSKPHPFRVYPAGHAKAGQPIMGYTRFVLVVPDGQGELYTDNAGQLRVTAGTDERGFARARFEIPLYSHKHTGQDKKDDDWVDAARGILAQFALHAGERSLAERVEIALPKPLQLADAPTEVKRDVGWLLARAEAHHKAQQAIEAAEDLSNPVWNDWANSY